MLNKIFRNALLFLIGGIAYILIETLWRAVMGSSPTHWSMFIVGGFIFLFIGGINEWLPWNMSFLIQCFIGMVFTLIVELFSGCILNLWLNLNVWDYSHLQYNILGQICPQYASAWYLLSGIAIIIDDWLRHLMFNEEKPHYYIFKRSGTPMKKIEFSKVLVTWAIILTTLCVLTSYALSYFDHDPATDVTVTVATTCIAIAVAYEAKSFGEKNSRNKYGIGDDGSKITFPKSKDDDAPLG